MSAPSFNSFNALTGDVVDPPRNTAFWAALEETDDLLAEVETLRANQTRIDELEEELAAVKERNLLARADADDAAETIGLLLEENAELKQRNLALVNTIADMRQQLVRATGGAK